jgi:nucleoside-diphosphate-sugar epimerase
MNALVTGGAGFIGSHLVDKLVDDNRVDKVIVVDNLSSGLKSNLKKHLDSEPSNITFLNLDISKNDSKKLLADVMRAANIDTIFHLAAAAGVPFSVKEPMESYKNNDFSTFNVLEASRLSDVKRVVISSSSSIYGGSKSFPTVESDNAYLDFNPQSPYAQYKAIGEQFCRLYSNVYGLDTACLRYFNIFGPRQRADSAYAAVVASFLDASAGNKTPVIHGDGTQFRDFTYVANAVHANMLAGFHHEPIGGESFNVGTGSKISVNDIHKESGAPMAKYTESRAGDVYGSQASIEKISKRLGYEVLVNFKDGMSLTKEWYDNVNNY